MQFNRVISLIVIVKGLIILHHPTLKDRSINYLLLFGKPFKRKSLETLYQNNYKLNDELRYFVFQIQFDLEFNL